MVSAEVFLSDVGTSICPMKSAPALCLPSMLHASSMVHLLGAWNLLKNTKSSQICSCSLRLIIPFICTASKMNNIFYGDIRIL